MTDWVLKKFDELSRNSLYQLLQLRCDVFVVEQACAYPELDGRDQASTHLMGYGPDGSLLAYARILPRGLSFEEVSIGRVLISREARGQGLARQLMTRAIDFVSQEWQEQAIKIEAQYYLRDFYASLGFREVSEPFLDDGIKHVAMLKD